MIAPPIMRSKYNPLDIRFYHNLVWFLRFRFERWFGRVCPRRWNPVFLAQEAVVRESGRQVMAGPFKGMPYVFGSFGSVYEAKLMGTYELELYRWIERLCARPYKRIVVVGAAEGYFVVGFGRRIRDASITAFDSSLEAQRLLRELVGINQLVSRVSVHGFCRHADLAGAIGSARPCLVFMDVEGGEYELLDPDAVPGLRTCDVLVELHECFRTRTDRAIEDRFNSTHHVERVSQRGRSLRDVPFKLHAGELLLKLGLRRIMNEQRGYPQTWFLMLAKDVRAGTGQK